VDIVALLKAESDVPLRSQGSLSLNWALMAAGLVDRLQVTIFPATSGCTGTSPVLGGEADSDLELLESRTLDGRTQELTYRPSLHGPDRSQMTSRHAGRPVTQRAWSGSLECHLVHVSEYRTGLRDLRLIAANDLLDGGTSG